MDSVVITINERPFRVFVDLDSMDGEGSDPVLDILRSRKTYPLELERCRVSLTGTPEPNQALAEELFLVSALEQMCHPKVALEEMESLKTASAKSPEPQPEPQAEPEPEPEPITKVRFSFGKGFAGGRTSDVESATAGWDQLHALLTVSITQKNSRFISPGLQPKKNPDSPGTNRRDSTGHDATFVALDFDGIEGKGDPLRSVATLLRTLREKRIGYIACSTYSNGKKAAPGHTRWRLLVPTEVPIPSDVYYRRTWQNLGDWIRNSFGLETDPALGHIAAVSYIGQPPGDPRAWSRMHIGGGWSVDLEPPIVSPPRRRTRKQTLSDADGAYRYIQKVPGVGEGNRHQSALSLGAKLRAKFDLNEESFMDLMNEWGQTCEPPLSEYELEKISNWFATKE